MPLVRALPYKSEGPSPNQGRSPSFRGGKRWAEPAPHIGRPSRTASISLLLRHAGRKENPCKRFFPSFDTKTRVPRFHHSARPSALMNCFRFLKKGSSCG